MADSIAGITPGELAKIRKRHGDIPQDALFDDVPQAVTKGVEKERRPRSIAWAQCPECRTGLVGLLAVTADTVQFRQHNRKVGRVTIPCSGSGRMWDGARYDSPRATF